MIWPEVIERARRAGRPTVTYLLFMILAVILAGIAVVTDSAILVVGAMVVGPEFASVAAVSVGLALRRWEIAWRAGAQLLAGFAVAILAVALLALVAVAGGLIDGNTLAQPRPQTSFIWRPDVWSFIVAVVAGTAGVLAMSTDRGGAMVGVFISVTTVPAVGNFALALALRDPAEMAGSAAQLGLNLVGMVMAGACVIVLQRLLWQRVLLLSERLVGSRAPRHDTMPA